MPGHPRAPCQLLLLLVFPVEQGGKRLVEKRDRDDRIGWGSVREGSLSQDLGNLSPRDRGIP